MYLRIRVDNRLPTVLRDSCSKSVNCHLSTVNFLYILFDLHRICFRISYFFQCRPHKQPYHQKDNRNNNPDDQP